MAFKTSTTKISNNDFKKMIMKATHKHYITMDVKKEMAKMHKSAIVHSENKAVYKHEAVEIMDRLHHAGLAHHMLTDAHTFVHREVRKDISVQKTREKQLKEEHLAEIQKEKAEEAKKAAAKADKGKVATKKPGQSPHLASNAPAQVQHHAEPEAVPAHTASQPHFQSNVATHHGVSETPVQSSPSIHSSGTLTTQNREPEALDLAID